MSEKVDIKSMLARKTIAALKEMGVDVTELPESDCKYMVRLNDLYEEMLEKQDAAILQLKETDASIDSISKRLGISRNTIYTKHALYVFVSYIEKSLNERNPIKISGIAKKRLKAKEDLNAILDKNIDMMQFKVTIRELEEKLAEKTKKYEEELALNRKLQTKIAALERKKSNENNVVCLNFNDK